MYSRDAARRLWAKTGFTAQDMDLALMYDCFTYTVMATFEDYGFCGKGEVGDFFREGRATYGGDVVVNPHGGLLSEGYLHGLNHHYEAVLQLRGDAGGRQVPDARLALVTAGAGPYGSSLVYGNEPDEPSAHRGAAPAGTRRGQRRLRQALDRRAPGRVPLRAVPALAAAAPGALPPLRRRDRLRAGGRHR